MLNFMLTHDFLHVNSTIAGGWVKGWGGQELRHLFFVILPLDKNITDIKL